MNEKNIEIVLIGLRRRLNNEPLSLCKLFYNEAKREAKESLKTYSENVIRAKNERVEAYKRYLKERGNK